MTAITNFLKSVFNFFVGDWLILIGMVIAFVVTWLLLISTNTDAVKTWGGLLIVVGVAVSLAVTLRRETGH